MWGDALRLVVSKLLLVAAAVGAAGCSLFDDTGVERQQAGQICSPSLFTAEASIDSYVHQYYCADPNNPSNLQRGVYVVTIDKQRPNSELWVMEEPLATSPADPSIRRPLERFAINDPAILGRSRSLVQVNGFTFDNGPGETALPTTRTFESTYPIAPYALGGTRYDNPEYLLWFGSRSGRLQLGIQPPPNEVLGFEPYNVVGSTWPVMIAGECQEQVNDAQANWPIIGYSPTHAVMMLAQAPYFANHQLCTILEGFGVTDALAFDGGNSAGMYLNSPNAIPDASLMGRAIPVPVRIGLVTLGDVQVPNHDFSSPHLPNLFGGIPTGRHPFSGLAIPSVEWDGALVLYDNRYTDPQSGHRVAAPGNQVVGLRPREPGETDYISTQLDTPTDRYCMLRFFHGYYKPTGCSPGSSELTVRIKDTGGAVLTTSVYQSEPSTSGDGARLKGEWLRFTTPGAGRTVLEFQASHPAAEGVCHVLLDDVSVACAE